MLAGKGLEGITSIIEVVKFNSRHLKLLRSAASENYQMHFRYEISNLQYPCKFK